MDMSLLTDVTTEDEELPRDMDGNAIYKIKCEEDFWIDSVPDGHWWKVVGKILKAKESLQHVWDLSYAIIHSVQNIQQRR